MDTDEVGSEDAEEILNTLIDRSNGLVRGCQMKAVLLLKGCKAPPIDSDYDLLSDTIDIIDTEVNIEIAYSLQFKIGGCIVNPVYCSRCHLAHAWNSVDCSTVQARKLREEQFGTYSTNRVQKKNKNKPVAERSPAMPPAKELPKASPFKKSKKMMLLYFRPIITNLRYTISPPKRVQISDVHTIPCRNYSKTHPSTPQHDSLCRHNPN
jgi:hypothetical protein